MAANLVNLSIKVVRWVDDEPQPGIVACEFVDADGRCHTLIDKILMFADTLNSESKYPQPGVVRCSVLRRWRDSQGRDLVSISTVYPDWVESVDKLSEFVVLQSQVSSLDDLGV